MKELLLKAKYFIPHWTLSSSPHITHTPHALLHTVLLVPAVDAVAHAGQLLDDRLELCLSPRLAPVLQHAAPSLISLVMVSTQSGSLSDIILTSGPAVEFVHFPINKVINYLSSLEIEYTYLAMEMASERSIMKRRNVRRPKVLNVMWNIQWI